MGLSFPWRSANRNWLGGGLLVFCLAAGCLWTWQRWGRLLTSRSSWQLTVQAIEVTAQPVWIRSDVKEQVFRDGSLSSLSLLDPEVTVKVAQAFAMHPWVAKVLRVSKHPSSKVIVRLEYRRPVAMVEVTYGDKGGVFPVDGYGLLLPKEDFALPNGDTDAEKARSYIRIAARDAWPAGLVGASWGDDRIVGGAQIAEIIGPAWKPLGMYRIVVSEDPQLVRRPNEPLYELQTRSGKRIIWGSAPGKEDKGEPSVGKKIARLAAYLKHAGPLDQLSQSILLDLRDYQQPAPAPNQLTPVNVP